MRTLFVGFRVTDLDRSLTFYLALGYRELGRIALPDGNQLAPLSFPDEPAASLELVHRPTDGPAEPGGFDHLAIRVDDLDATCQELIRRGLTPRPTEFPGGPDGPRTAQLVDPDGYRIELVQWPPGHHWGMTAEDFA